MTNNYIMDKIRKNAYAMMYEESMKDCDSKREGEMWYAETIKDKDQVRHYMVMAMQNAKHLTIASNLSEERKNEIIGVIESSEEYKEFENRVVQMIGNSIIRFASIKKELNSISK